MRNVQVNQVDFVYGTTRILVNDFLDDGVAQLYAVGFIALKTRD